jgi:pyridoxamine 5'-phosphate oxidase
MIDFSDRRKDYTQNGLEESGLTKTPFELFDQWLRIALESNLPEPYAMTLATATTDGAASARIVLLRQADQRGLVFFTNYLSRKGREICENPRGSLLFYWPELERQVRIEGLIARITPSESDDYHRLRPPNSRIGAAASEQSKILPNRKALEDRVAELFAKFPNGEIPRPEHWGGYRLCPEYFEFWQGRTSRLHDRLFYQLGPGGIWETGRLAP